MEKRRNSSLSPFDFAKQVLFGETLEDKLLAPTLIDWSTSPLDHSALELPKEPGRPANLKFSMVQARFPRRQSLTDKKQRARALHFFANHELLAIEMLAGAMLIFDCKKTEEDWSFLKSCVSTLKDEQRHLSLYQERMRELGLEFGSIEVNDFFWDKMLMVKTRAEFLSLLSLTFESANLDFSLYYAGLFKEVGDLKSAEIMQEVYRDELSHVRTGAHWLNLWRKDQELWEYYLKNLPALITPERARGVYFDRESRLKAGLAPEFVDKLEKYESDFRVTKRREWK